MYGAGAHAFCPFASWLAVASYISLVSYYLHLHPLPLSGETSHPPSISWTLHGGHVSGGSTSFVRPFLPCTCFAAHGLITTLFAALCNGVRIWLVPSRLETLQSF